MSPRIQELAKRLAVPEQATNLFTAAIQIPPHIAALPPIPRPPKPPAPGLYDQIMPYEDGLKKFRAIFAEAGTKEREKRQDPKFVVKYTDEQVKIVKDLVKYFINDRTGPYDITKGILLYGPSGCGKTQLMLRFREFAQDTVKAFEWSNHKIELGVARETPGYPIVAQSVLFNRCLDEFPFTRELGIVSNGNNFTKTYDQIIHTRHTHKNKFTHITTNVPPGEFPTYMEDANVDRINEMVNIIRFVGESMR